MPEPERLTSTEVARAIYLDFEGKAPSKSGEKYPPTLCGWVEEGKYSFVVFDDRFAGPAHEKLGRATPMKDFIGDLVTRASREERRIVHWTSKEAEDCAEVGFPLRTLGYDLRPLVKRRHPDIFSEAKEAKRAFKSAPKSLQKKLIKKAYGLCVACAEKEGLKVPTTYGWGSVGTFIRECETQLGRPYPEWSPGKKRKWSRLLAHNELDCRAMVVLARRLFS